MHHAIESSHQALIVNSELKSHIPPLRDDEYSQLEISLRTEGCREAIVTWGDTIVDGHNRYEICTRNGIAFRTVHRDFDDIEDVKAWMEDNQLGRRNLAPEMFTYFIGRKYGRMKSKQGGDHKSKDQNDPLINAASAIASEHGVSAPTVKRAEKFANAIDKIAEKAGQEAKTRLLSGQINATRDVIERAANIAAERADAGQDINIEEIVEGIKAEASRPVEIVAALDTAPTNDNAPHVRGTLGTGENEWYTPVNHLDLAREVLGGIDLDPASSEIANRTVRADKIFTIDDNGLEKDWHGRVWMNPPYAQPAIAQFANKLVTEWEAGNIDAAISLTHNYTDTAWFQQIAKAATAVCFTRGRVRFVSPSGELASPTQGQAFAYFGNEIDKFFRSFSPFGIVFEARK